MGMYFMYKERQWTDAYTALSKQYQDAEAQLAVYKLETYDGPYGILSHVKYNQVQSVPSKFPLSSVTQYEQASCEKIADVDGKPVPSNAFDLTPLAATTALKELSEGDLAKLQQVVRDNLTLGQVPVPGRPATDGRLPVYNLSSVCVLGPEKLFLLGFDYSNSALRVPIVVDREDGNWLVRKLPPTLTPFVTSTLVRLHPDGNPLIFDVYQGEEESAWQAYYIDSQFQIVDLIESCRIVDQGEKHVRICERLYEQES